MDNRTVLSRYIICGFISSGTYGRVYKARARSPSSDASPRGLMGTPSAGGAGVGTPRKVDGEEESEGELFAIKKFKPDKEGEAVTYTGISQSACREIMVMHILVWRDRDMLIQTFMGQINREISHEHVTALREVMLEEKSIYLIFEYAEHDFLVRANFGYPELI